MRDSTLQLGLFGREALAVDETFASAERVELGERAWIDLVRGWVRGQRELFDHLVATAPWRDEERVMYDHVVAVPRRIATLETLHPLVVRMRALLDARYGTAFERVSAAHYRDGRDSVAWHGDYVARKMDEALVATVSLGSPRRFFIRPKGGGQSVSFTLEGGDLVVMGGTCQRTHEHAIPKVAEAGPRVALMFRPVWRDPSR